MKEIYLVMQNYIDEIKCICAFNKKNKAEEFLHYINKNKKDCNIYIEIAIINSIKNYKNKKMFLIKYNLKTSKIDIYNANDFDYAIKIENINIIKNQLGDEVLTTVLFAKDNIDAILKAKRYINKFTKNK